MNGRFKAIYDIITGCKTWICIFDPELKRYSAQWAFTTDPNTSSSSEVLGKMIVCFLFGKMGSIVNFALKD